MDNLRKLMDELSVYQGKTTKKSVADKRAVLLKMKKECDKMRKELLAARKAMPNRARDTTKKPITAYEVSEEGE